MKPDENLLKEYLGQLFKVAQTGDAREESYIIGLDCSIWLIGIKT